VANGSASGVGLLGGRRITGGSGERGGSFEPHGGLRGRRRPAPPSSRKPPKGCYSSPGSPRAATNAERVRLLGVTAHDLASDRIDEGRPRHLVIRGPLRSSLPATMMFAVIKVRTK
jgi:hypothetical protein